MKIAWGTNAKTNRLPSVASSKPGLPFGVDSDYDEEEKEETREVTTDCPGTKPADTAESLQHLGNKLAEEGKYHEALGKWEAALTLMPNNAILHEQKAQILLELGDAWRALAAATRATELDPSWPEAWVTLGRAQLNFGEPDSAILSFDKALAIKPDYDEAKSDRETAARLVKKRGQLHSSGSNRSGPFERSFQTREMWRKGNKRFGGGGGEPAAKRQAAGEDGPSGSTDEGIVVAQVRIPHFPYCCCCRRRCNPSTQTSLKP
ncbi:hypothetical protein E2562_008717 [Oryza meyeriana var. granulata]|uniref:Uncharacterized protein n=1 Tax=Oryza meyeriana var. granulata TaxID=110450 RepID=A0A6G1F5J3_9ORYZ|nr:hypothetical protein E2562_008717 [Oryza meyeriana var. granulata]